MLRQAKQTDFEAIYKLGVELHANYRQLHDLKKIIVDKNQKIFVLEINDTIIGFIHISISYEEADIIDIIVEKSMRKQGYASKMINKIIDEYKLKKINIEVRESNKIAQNFYLKQNFKVVRKIKNYYGNEDALLMIKEV